MEGRIQILPTEAQLVQEAPAMAFADDTLDKDLDFLIFMLERRLGRLPTVEEVFKFIKGDEWDRLVIWNSAKKEAKHG